MNEKKHHKLISYTLGDETDPLLVAKFRDQDYAWNEIGRKFPEVDPAKAPFTAGLDEYDQVEVRLKIKNC